MVFTRDVRSSQLSNTFAVLDSTVTVEGQLQVEDGMVPPVSLSLGDSSKPNPLLLILGLGRKPKGRAASEFNDCLHALELDDLPTEGFGFAWTNKRGGLGDNKSKLDSAMVNASWLSAYPNSEAWFLHLEFQIIVRLNREHYSSTSTRVEEARLRYFSMGPKSPISSTSFILLLPLVLTALLTLVPSTAVRLPNDSRPKLHGSSSNVGETKNFLGGFSLGTAERSGPSSPGTGNRSRKQVRTTVGKVKNGKEGPSPGEGNDYADDNHT
ncbi:hypothetical protein RHSIM_Rhsim11G0159800 [Rhododendron simsii]|uniref:Uncharacterized protein n=1 Tax=Rhododendron simsii TaxID=118357 RepID=A0A834L7V5_RHOSS|nr:hypothetical protein RHSIM_Rhsim11G0159800 [Rhododendron simsii]